MKAILLVTSLFLVILIPGSIVAQYVQDPNDLGVADTVRMEFSLVPDAATNQLDVQADLYLFNDAQFVGSASFGFYWLNDNMDMTEAYFTEYGAAAFDFIQFLYRNAKIDSTNAHDDFMFVGLRVFGTGMEASTEAKHVATYKWTLSNWSILDSILLDTAVVLGGTFALVDDNNHEYRPYWDGRIEIFDANRPIISNLVLPEDTLRFQAIEGGANPPSQVVQVTSDRDPLTFELVEDVSWLLKSPSTGTTPEDLTISVTTTGMTAGTYFDSISVQSGGAANSPQFIFVEFELAPPLPIIEVDRDEFFFNTLAGTDPAPQNLTISNAGQSTLNWTVSNTESWLELLPGSGSGPGTVTLTISSSSLIFGDYYDTIVVSDPVATNSPVRIPVRLSVASDLPVIVVDSIPNYWAVSYDERPMFYRSFGVRNGGAGTLDFWVETQSEDIIGIVPPSSTAPDSVALYFYIIPDPVNPEPTDPTLVTETVWVYSSEAINSPVEVECQLLFVAMPAEIEVSTASVQFDVYECYQGYGQSLPSMGFTVDNIGSADPMPVDIAYESELFEVIGAETSQPVPASYTINALLPDLALGTYLDTIWVTSQWAINKPQIIEVTFNFLSATETPVILVSDPTLSIPWQEGSGPMAFNELEIFNTHAGCLTWELSESIDWLTLIETQGTVPDPSPLLLDPTGYTLGEYSGALTVTAPSASNSPFDINCTLQVWKLYGDVNWNGQITVQDISLLIDYIFEQEHAPQPMVSIGDVNCDDQVTVTDITLMIEYLFETLEPLCGNPY